MARAPFSSARDKHCVRSGVTLAKDTNPWFSRCCHQGMPDWPEEFRVARSYGIGNVSSLAAISYGLLMLIGGDAELLYSFFWVVGGILGGYVALRVLPKGKISFVGR